MCCAETFLLNPVTTEELRIEISGHQSQTENNCSGRLLEKGRNKEDQLLMQETTREMLEARAEAVGLGVGQGQIQRNLPEVELESVTGVRERRKVKSDSPVFI